MLVHKELKNGYAKKQENKCPDSYGTAAFARSQSPSVVIQLLLLNHLLNSVSFCNSTNLTSSWLPASTKELLYLPSADAIYKLKRFPVKDLRWRKNKKQC